MSPRQEVENIHTGHRFRMREKLFAHGEHIFDTYELLEMLLYSVIPYMDTNPIAKRLLKKFGSLDEILHADREELVEVEGVGEKCAGFLRSVGEVIDLCATVPLFPEVICFSNYEDTLQYAVKYFEENENVCVSVLLLDGRMRLIKTAEIEGGGFHSGAVRIENFVDIALCNSAHHMIILLSHKYGAAHLTEDEFFGLRLLRSRLLEMGISMPEVLIVSGKRAYGVEKLLGSSGVVYSSSSDEYNAFIAGKNRGAVT